MATEQSKDEVTDETTDVKPLDFMSDDENEDEVLSSAEYEAEFIAGFQSLEETPEPKPESKKPVEQDDVTDEASGEDDKAGDGNDEDDKAGDKPPVVLAGMTEDEIKAMFAKASELAGNQDKAFGKIGELNRTIQELKTAMGSGKKLSPALKRLSGEFPDIAELLLEDLKESYQDSGGFDPSAIRSMIDEAVTKSENNLRDYYEEQLLTVYHKDWRTVIKGADWETWKTTLDKERLEKLQKSSDSTYVADAMTDFKTWRDSRNAEAEKKAEDKRKAKEVEEERKRRLERSLPPRRTQHTGTVGLDEEEAFIAGFKEASGG